MRFPGLLFIAMLVSSCGQPFEVSASGECEALYPGQTESILSDLDLLWPDDDPYSPGEVTVMCPESLPEESGYNAGWLETGEDGSRRAWVPRPPHLRKSSLPWLLVNAHMQNVHGLVEPEASEKGVWGPRHDALVLAVMAR